MALLTAQPGPEPSFTKRDGEKTEDSEWLVRARDAYETSTDYFESSIRGKIERSIAHFQNRHAPGSKYYTASYAYRSRGFRPKTRTMVRRGEAEAAAAYFSTDDLVRVQSRRENSPVHRVSAEVNNELLNFRLQTTIPWFLTVIGAYQDAIVQGVCISHQFWNYVERTDQKPLEDDEQGRFLTEEGDQASQDDTVVLSDKPEIELRPVENIRFSPSANWIDPLNSSPYLIDRIPMDVGAVKAKMPPEGEEPSEKKPWYRLDESQLSVGRDEDGDQGVRAQREAGREDSKQQKHVVNDYDTVWVHRNIIRHEQRDWIFYTLGTWYLLSDPVPLKQEYRHLREGERPYTMGYATLETHKTHPASPADITAPLQQEANDINNSRRDNVNLVMQRRYFARRGAEINYRQLKNAVPGGVTEMGDINNDIRSEAPPEVTQSAYAEQDRVNMDYDELSGTFSASSVGSNRQLNETVGGMKMLGGEANKIGEYQLRLFNESWVEKTLSQVVRMEQAYETDPGIFNMLGEKAKLWQRFGLSRLQDFMIQGDMDVKINVGIGATNPDQRLNRVLQTIGTLAKAAPQLMSKLDEHELAAEIFGAMGHKSIDRFLPPEDEGKQEGPPPEDPAVTMKKMELQARQQEKQMDLQEAEKDRQFRMMEMEHESNMKALEFSQESKLTFDQIKAKLGETAMRERGQNERFMAEKQFAITHGEGRGL